MQMDLNIKHNFQMQPFFDKKWAKIVKIELKLELSVMMKIPQFSRGLLVKEAVRFTI